METLVFLFLAGLFVFVLLLILGAFDSPAQPDHQTNIEEINRETRGRIDTVIEEHKLGVFAYLYEKHKEALEETFNGSGK